MKFSSLIKKNKNQESRPRKNLPHIMVTDPYFDWVVIVGVAVAVTIVLVSIGVYTFVNFDDSGSASTGVSNAAQNESVDTSTLRKVLKKFDDRASRRSELLKGFAGPADPSI